MADTGYKVLINGTYVDLVNIFAPLGAGTASSNSGYKSIGYENKDLSQIFAPYVSGQAQAVQTYYLVANNDLNLKYAKIGYEIIILNNNLCIEVKENTNINTSLLSTFLNKTNLRFVAVGGGGRNVYSGTFPTSYGGVGGYIVYGTINISNTEIMQINIGQSEYPTTITGNEINISAGGSIFYTEFNQQKYHTGDGSNFGSLLLSRTYTSATGSNVLTYNLNSGSAGGNNYSYGINEPFNGGIRNSSYNGANGIYINDLGIYVAGGGAGKNLDYYNNIVFGTIGFAGLGGGGENMSPGIPNTGGGAGCGTYGTIIGGSGVVYLY